MTRTFGRWSVISVGVAIAAAIWLLSAAPSMATTAFTVRETIPLDGVVIDGCDEPIMLSGSLYAIFHLTELDSGAVTGVSVSGPSGVSGTGLTSGAQYRAVGATINVGYQDASMGEPVLQLTLTLVDAPGSSEPPGPPRSTSAPRSI
jgi:hypothetical protein